MSWDTRILYVTASLRSEGLDSFFRGITWLGSLYVLTPVVMVIGVILLYLQKRAECMLLLLGFGGATLLVHVAKTILDRSRPALMEPLVALPTDSSFPSAHTVQIVAFTLSMVLICRRIVPEWQAAAIVAALIVALAVAASRIYLQVHFPSDVLAGIILSIGWVALVQKFL